MLHEVVRKDRGSLLASCLFLCRSAVAAMHNLKLFCTDRRINRYINSPTCTSAQLCKRTYLGTRLNDNGMEEEQSKRNSS